MVRFMM